MRIALWIASPPTCSVRTPRASLTAMDDVAFLPDKGREAEGSKEREGGGGEDRQVVGAERIERGARKPRPEQRADAGPGIEAADDARNPTPAVEIHHDRRDQRHRGALAQAEDQREG